MTQPVSREEFAMLQATVAENARRVEHLDEAGTRGVGVIQVQLSEVIKDVTTVQRDLAGFRTDHERQHDREQASRQSARRWTIATGIAFLAAIEGPLLYLLTHVH